MPVKEVPYNVQLIPSPCTFEQLVWLATAIHENKKDLPWWRAKNVNGYVFPEYLLRGFVAEVLFGLRFGLQPDFTLRDGGDNGIDFILPVLLELRFHQGRNSLRIAAILWSSGV
jgi:hypothetical protein